MMLMVLATTVCHASLVITFSDHHLYVLCCEIEGLASVYGWWPVSERESFTTVVQYV